MDHLLSQKNIKGKQTADAKQGKLDPVGKEDGDVNNRW